MTSAKDSSFLAFTSKALHTISTLVLSSEGICQVFSAFYFHIFRWGNIYQAMHKILSFPLCENTKLLPWRFKYFVFTVYKNIRSINIRQSALIYLTGLRTGHRRGVHQKQSRSNELLCFIPCYRRPGHRSNADTCTVRQLCYIQVACKQSRLP